MSESKGSNGNGALRRGAESFELKVGLAEMMKNGVIMDVVDPDQAKVAEDSGACAVMALERVPSDIRRDGGVARMSNVEMSLGISGASRCEQSVVDCYWRYSRQNRGSSATASRRAA